MHFLPSAKDYTRHTLTITPGQTVRDLFTSNGYIVANFTSGNIQGSPAALHVGTMEDNNIFSFVLTTNGWVWIRDRTLTNGEVKSSLVYVSGTLKPSHVQSLLTSNVGKSFVTEWCKTVLVSDLGNLDIDQKEGNDDDSTEGVPVDGDDEHVFGSSSNNLTTADTRRTSNSARRNLANELKTQLLRRMATQNREEPRNEDTIWPASDSNRIFEQGVVTRHFEPYGDYTLQSIRSRSSRRSMVTMELVFDSGCTHHMVYNDHLLTDIVFNDRSDSLASGQVYCGYGATLDIAGYGNLWPLGNVLYVPEITHNMISVKMLTSHGWAVNFIGDKASVMDLRTMSTIMTASVKGGLYMLHWDRHIDEILREGFDQSLPTLDKTVESHMTRISCYISDTHHILQDPVNYTNKL